MKQSRGKGGFLRLVMKWLRKTRFRSLQGQGGFTLLETLVAVAILAAIAVVFLSALTTASKNTDLYQQRVTAANLAQSQVEVVKAAPYDDTPPYYDNLSPSITLPPGYNIAISTVQLDVGRQEITVRVTKDNRPLFKLTIIKTNWA